eukprot:4812894-Pyramimonas_sp.AAC.1
MRGTTLSAVPGIFGERHELALTANSGNMVDGMPTAPLDICSNSSQHHWFGNCTAQTFGRASRSHGNDIKKLDLTKRLR